MGVTSAVIYSLIFWDAYEGGEFSFAGFANLALLILVVLIPTSVVYLVFRRNRSVNLDDEGASVEVLSFFDGNGLLPKFQRKVLLWNEVKEFAFVATVIRLRGEHVTIDVNMLYFDDAEAVYQFIARQQRLE